MKISREEEKIIRVVVVLSAGERFKLPASTQPGAMTVSRLVWNVSGGDNFSHPIDASATDDGGVHWTLSLRMSDVPEPIRSEMEKVAAGGGPAVADWSGSGMDKQAMRDNGLID